MQVNGMPVHSIDQKPKLYDLLFQKQQLFLIEIEQEMYLASFFSPTVLDLTLEFPWISVYDNLVKLMEITKF